MQNRILTFFLSFFKFKIHNSPRNIEAAGHKKHWQSHRHSVAQTQALKYTAGKCLI